jgi:hypothetical protein
MVPSYLKKKIYSRMMTPSGTPRSQRMNALPIIVLLLAVPFSGSAEA